MNDLSHHHRELPAQSTPNLRYNNTNLYPVTSTETGDTTTTTPANRGTNDTPDDTQFSSVNSVKDEHSIQSTKDDHPIASSTSKKPAEVKSADTVSYPPLFIGVSLPGERPGIEYSYTDETLVERSLLEEYDMITSRISTPAYRARVEALFAESEACLMNNAGMQVKSLASVSMPPPPLSPPRVQPLQSRPLRNENTANYMAFVRSPSVEASSSFKSSHSVNSTGWLDRGSPVPSLFSTANKFPHRPNSSPLTSHKAPTEPAYSLPFTSFDVPPLEFDDILLLPGAHIRNVIALTAPWVELDSKNPRIAALSVRVLLQEIAYAIYCGITYFIVCGPKRRTNVEQYAQAISQILKALPSYCHLLVHLPLAEEDYISSRTGERVPPTDYLSIWDVWNTIRTINNYPSNLSVVLQVPPKCNFPAIVSSRWYAEPVKMLMISSAIFVSNARGYPVLPKATQSLLFKFFRKNPFLILSDVYDRDFQGGATSYLLYVRHLVKIRPKPTAIEAYSEGYYDLLQVPPQPLVGNLESSTYEVFERDPVKYAQYGEAIYKALRDIHKSYIHVAVVGAGRGPLVDRVLAAAKRLGKDVYIYAIEKNESAFVHLTRRLQYEWTEQNVEIVLTDMRKWRPVGVRLSLIVSELLGSFGDNELSPECLDGLDCKTLLDSDGIMIPQSYSAYFTPAMSATLYNSARNFKAKGSVGSNISIPGRPGVASGSSMGGEAHIGGHNATLQTPYVVMLNSIDYLSPGQFAKAWTFSHPSRLPDSEPNLHNTRKAKHVFTVPSQGVIHGLAGYFECTLYRDVHLSTRPDTSDSKSKDMLSWFPLWFPLSTPLYISEGSEVDVSMWRLTDKKRVWYEWAVETYYKTPLEGGGKSAAATSSTGFPSSNTTSKHRRRVRTGVSQLHNANGQYFEMTL